MRMMGIDIGSKRIGVAISDELGYTAQGVEVIHRDKGRVLERIKELAKAYRVERIVVGLPKNMNGTVGERGEEALRFGRKLEAALSLPVVFWDERLTTVMAERTLISADIRRKKRKQVVDQLAATLILQNYLDSQGGKTNER